MQINEEKNKFVKQAYFIVEPLVIILIKHILN